MIPKIASSDNVSERLFNASKNAVDFEAAAASTNVCASSPWANRAVLRCSVATFATAKEIPL